ncbi:MAG: hypothetical protein K2F74_08700, partial [Muribaculaceae bacterium]|nr:hypothetical protein [Muribaculaceae bacterium]
GYKCVTWGASSVKNSVPTIMKRLGSVATIMLMTPGPKMIWQFGELGADETTKKANGDNDTSPKRVLWNYINDPDRIALHDIYRELCGIRTLNPGLFGNDAEYELNGNNSITASRTIRVKKDNKEVIAFLNPRIGGDAVTVTATSTILNANNCKLVTATPGFEPVLTGTGTSVSVDVPAHSMAVFATTDTKTGVDDVVSGTENSQFVIGGQGCISIIGDYNTAEVYTLEGRRCGLENLASGIYIVRVDGRSCKTVVY